MAVDQSQDSAIPVKYVTRKDIRVHKYFFKDRH